MEPKSLNDISIYLLNALPNALLVPEPGQSRDILGISPEAVVHLLINYQIISAIGHQSTADVLTKKLNIPIEFNRRTITPNPDDLLIVAAFVPPRRLNEGEFFSEEEILAMEIRYAQIRY